MLALWDEILSLWDEELPASGITPSILSISLLEYLTLFGVSQEYGWKEDIAY